MNSLDFLEELTEVEESTVQGGRTTFITPFGNIPLTRNPQPWGAYVSFPLALATGTGGTILGPNGLWGIRFDVVQQTDVPTKNFFSGPFLGILSNGLAGVLGLNTANS